MSLRTQALSCADAFNYSILHSFSQVKQESGTNNIFLLLSVPFWLSVDYSAQTPFKSKSESRALGLCVQLAGPLCFPHLIPSPPTLTAWMPLSLCLETIRSNLILSFILFELGFTKRSSDSPSHPSFPGLSSPYSPHVTSHLIS